MNPKPFQQLTAPAGDPVADNQDPINAGARGPLLFQEHVGARRAREGLRRIWRAHHHARHGVI